VERLRNPAGLDLGARMPDDVAISILAEIVRQGSLHGSGDAAGTVSAGVAVGHGSGHAMPAPAAASTPEPGIAIDPVCQMEVAVNGALHTAEIGGTRYYFCCGGCRTRFVKDPQRYLAATP